MGEAPAGEAGPSGPQGSCCADIYNNNVVIKVRGALGACLASPAFPDGIWPLRERDRVCVFV